MGSKNFASTYTEEKWNLETFFHSCQSILFLHFERIIGSNGPWKSSILGWCLWRKKEREFTDILQNVSGKKFLLRPLLSYKNHEVKIFSVYFLRNKKWIWKPQIQKYSMFTLFCIMIKFDEAIKVYWPMVTLKGEILSPWVQHPTMPI